MNDIRRIDTVVIAVLVAAVMSISLLAGGQASAQGRDWNRTDDVMTGAIGVHGGWIGGSGLAYKYPMRWWLYLQVAGGIWHVDDDDNHNLGCELQYLLRQDSRMRIFTVVGAGYYYHRNAVFDANDNKTFKTDHTWYKGFGVGVEYLYTERISLQGELDFTHDSGDGDFILLPQAGVFFYF